MVKSSETLRDSCLKIRDRELTVFNKSGPETCDAFKISEKNE